MQEKLCRFIITMLSDWQKIATLSNEKKYVLKNNFEVDGTNALLQNLTW